MKETLIVMLVIGAVNLVLNIIIVILAVAKRIISELKQG